MAKGTVRIAPINGVKSSGDAPKLAGTIAIKSDPMTTTPVAVAPVAAAALQTAIAAPVMATSAAATPIAQSGRGIWSWLKWLLLGFAALIAVFFLVESCAGGSGEKVAEITTPSPAILATAKAGKTAHENVEQDKRAQEKARAVKKAQDEAAAVNLAAANATAKLEAEKQAVLALSNAQRAEKDGSIASAATPRKMSPPSVTGRYCGPSSSSLFNVTDATPISVVRLGSNPQFGNSLSYTPSEFFRRLQVKYQTTPRDKIFLDTLATSLGYRAFSEMEASMFSNDVLANGTSGLLGYGADHALQYSTLTVSDTTHLEAFKVRSENGTDVHFMKRCGNFMYVCQP